MRKAIIVERDYKGIFERFALLHDDFAEMFPDSPAPTCGGDTDTVAGLVHIWYMETDVGGELWHTFFTDMHWGLEHDEDTEPDTAYVRWNLVCPDLVEDVVNTIYHAEPEGFGEVRWYDDDIANELELLDYPNTPEAVSIVKADLGNHWFTDHIISAGYEYIDAIIRNHHDALLALDVD